MRVITTVAIASVALLASACTSNETTNVTNTVEVPTENLAVEDTMTTTNIDTAAPMGNESSAMETNTVDAGNSAMTNM